MKTLVNKKVLKALTDAELKEKHLQYLRLARTENTNHSFKIACKYAEELTRRKIRGTYRPGVKLTKKAKRVL